MGDIAEYMIEGLIDGTLDEDGVLIDPDETYRKKNKKINIRCSCGFSFWAKREHIGICNRCLNNK